MTIRDARIAAGLSQGDVHRLIGIPVNTISQWERGLRTPAPWIEKIVIAEIKRLTNNTQ